MLATQGLQHEATSAKGESYTPIKVILQSQILSNKDSLSVLFYHVEIVGRVYATLK